MSSGSRSNDAPHGRTKLTAGAPTGDDATLRDRVRFFQLEDDDAERLRALQPLAKRTVDEIIDQFYDHLLQFPPLAELLHERPDRLTHLKALQRRYFLSLTDGRFDRSYFEERLRVGDAHQRIGLSPDWYLGAFSLYLRLALRALVREHGQGDEILPGIESLVKAVFLDVSLAMDTYIYGGFVSRTAAGELERAAIAAAEALQAKAEIEVLKDDLSRMVVHDLKNPVNGIMMMAELALRKGRDLPEAQRGYLHQIQGTCEEMMRLIQNLLDISRLEDGKLPIEHEWIVLDELVAEIIAACAPVAQNGEQSLSSSIAPGVPPVVADRGLLKRVLVNLVVNALRHSVSPTVQVDVIPGPEPSEVTVRVVDWGRGIPPEEQAAIFEKFRSMRPSPSDAPVTDSGLGLPFCRLAVERMGGRISVTSEPGRKTVFAVTLPVHRESTA